MHRNIGLADKIIRILISVILIIIAVYFNIWWILLIAAIPFLTAFMGFCPIYSVFKINTKNKEKTMSDSPKDNAHNKSKQKDQRRK